MTAKEIANLIDHLQSIYAATSTALIMLNDNQILQLLEAKGYDKGSTIRLGRRNNSYYENIKLWDSINSVKANSQYNLDFLGSQFMTILSWVGYELSKNEYFNKTPELEFFRHLRNGISHGNKFSFRRGEPSRPAKFKQFEITSLLQGKPILFEFISTGDLFDLFDHVKNYLKAF